MDVVFYSGEENGELEELTLTTRGRRGLPSLNLKVPRVLPIVDASDRVDVLVHRCIGFTFLLQRCYVDLVWIPNRLDVHHCSTTVSPQHFDNRMGSLEIRLSRPHRQEAGALAHQNRNVRPRFG